VFITIAPSIEKETTVFKETLIVWEKPKNLYERKVLSAIC